MPVSTLFGQPAAPVTLTADNATYTMGVQFSVSAPAALTGLWFFSPPGAVDLPAACCIYLITGAGTGSQVAGTVQLTPSWSGAAGSGWVKVTYDGSVTLTPGNQYRACILHNQGGNFYGATATYWAGGGPGAGGITSGVLSAPAAINADLTNQDAFLANTAALTYPTGQFQSSNYWIDVEVTTAAAAASTGGDYERSRLRRELIW